MFQRLRFIQQRESITIENRMFRIEDAKAGALRQERA